MNAALELATAVTFVWLGMVIAISFLEAPLKFRAPGVTLPIGLGIGRLVFRSLNIAELLLATVVRVWVLDAGPNRPTSFHVVGGQFDTTYAEGAYLMRHGTEGGAQSLGLQAAQGGFVELTFPEPGDYPFVSHLMIDAERGAHGMFHVTP